MRGSHLLKAGIFSLAILLFLPSCEEEVSVPRPKGYPRVYLPAHSYQSYDGAGCPYSFQYPIYGQIEKDSLFFDVYKDCWIDIYFPGFDATIHFTYERMEDSLKIFQLVSDAHELSFKHARKAEYIDQIPIDKGDGVKGLLYDVGGDAASSVQFYLTDFDEHFMRGALYFNVSPNADSMSPMINFLKQDIEHLMTTFEWEE